MELAFRTRLPGKESLSQTTLRSDQRQPPTFNLAAPSRAETRRQIRLTRKISVRPEQHHPQSANPLRRQAKDGTHHRRVSMTQINAHQNLTLPYGPSLDASPPTRSPTLSCTTVRRPLTGQAKGKTRHCRTRLTQLDAHLNLTLHYGPSLGASPPTQSPLPSCTSVCRHQRARPRT